MLAFARSARKRSAERQIAYSPAMRVPPRPRLRFVSALAVVLLATVALPSIVAAATVEDLVTRAKTNWKLTCAGNADLVSCTNDALPLWTLRITPATGPIASVLTDAGTVRGILPLDANSVNWMIDMHQFACGDPKGIDAFVKQVGQLTIGPPAGQFAELTFNLPAHAAKTADVELRTEAKGMYRVFHWFVLQAE